MKQESKSGLAEQVREAFAINDDKNSDFKVEAQSLLQLRDQQEIGVGKKRNFKDRNNLNDLKKVMESDSDDVDQSEESLPKNVPQKRIKRKVADSEDEDQQVNDDEAFDKNKSDSQSVQKLDGDDGNDSEEEIQYLPGATIKDTAVQENQE